MSRLIGIATFALCALLTTTAWCQFPYVGSAYTGAPVNPSFPPSFGGYPLSQVRANPLTGAIESRALVIDSATGNVQVHRRIIPRSSLFGPTGVYDMTVDPATGTVRYNSLTTNGFSNEIRTNQRTYNPYTGSYDRQVTTYHPSGGAIRSSREAYNPATRRTSTEVTEYDPKTGTYFRRGGIPDVESAQVLQPGGRRQVKVLEWPPKDTETQAPASPPESSPR